MQLSKRILALDQSTQVTGWSVFVDGELKEYGKQDYAGDIVDRIICLKQWLSDYIDNSNSREELLIGLEEIQLQQIPGTSREGNVQTFKKLAWVQGVLVALIQEKSIPYKVVPSASWKSTCKVTGRNRAEQKRNAQAFVFDTYAIRATQDECDSICIGVHLVELEKEELNWE